LHGDDGGHVDSVGIVQRWKQMSLEPMGMEADVTGTNGDGSRCGGMKKNAEM